MMNRSGIGVSGLLLGGISLLVAAIVVIVLVAGRVLIQHESAHEQRVNQALLEAVRSKLQTGYRDLERELQERIPAYRQLHARARRRIERAGAQQAPIDRIAARFSERLGYPVHVYIINPDLRITRTTFPPDKGLDFTAQGLEDARAILETVKRQQTTLVGPPTLELASRQFRIYSYSPLGGDGYRLELGFSPPVVDELFRDVQASVGQTDLYDSDLFFLFNERWLISLTPKSEVAGLSKEQALAKIPAATQAERAKFERAVAKEGIYRPDGGGDTYYAWLNRIALSKQRDLEVLARLNMNHSGMDNINDILVVVLLAVAGLMLLAALTFYYATRRLLVVPLRQAAGAISRREPIQLRGAFARVRELRVLASHINQRLDATEEEVAGLDRLAHTDGLTGLINRMALDKELSRLVTEQARLGQPMALIVVDLDRFKAVNDRHGHARADALLQTVAERLAANQRPGDVLGRWGGEEFLILAPGADRDDGVSVAERLRRLLAADPDLRAYEMTASFGVSALMPSDTGTSLFERADQALYAAKRRGRNRVAAG